MAPIRWSPLAAALALTMVSAPPTCAQSEGVGILATRDALSQELARLEGTGDKGRAGAALIRARLENGDFQAGERIFIQVEGEATLAVLSPPSEKDDLRPDPESLATLARESGGRVWAVADIGKLRETLWQRDENANVGKPRWEPLWTRWWVAALVALVFGSEWWMRRREGLL